eukprot:scaffold1845_cov257-Pinguiococcus_pyrenoidosus.AAC.4
MVSAHVLPDLHCDRLLGVLHADLVVVGTGRDGIKGPHAPRVASADRAHRPGDLRNSTVRVGQAGAYRPQQPSTRLTFRRGDAIQRSHWHTVRWYHQKL